jgi:RNA polymerase sigma-70 factor (ECF subfamily)
MNAPQTPPDDVQCMSRLKGGDDLALNDLMTRWQKPLVSFILRYTGNEQDARDHAQQTYFPVF